MLMATFCDTWQTMKRVFTVTWFTILRYIGNFFRNSFSARDETAYSRLPIWKPRCYVDESDCSGLVSTMTLLSRSAFNSSVRASIGVGWDVLAFAVTHTSGRLSGGRNL